MSDGIAQDRFWTSYTRESRDVGSVSDLSMSDFDTRSEYDRYFAEAGARRDSAVASAGTQIGSSPWTLATPGYTQGVPRSSSDPSLVPPQFKKPRTPPPGTVVATTRTEMYMRQYIHIVIYTRIYFSFGEKILKIGPVDAEIIWLELKTRNYGK